MRPAVPAGTAGSDPHAASSMQTSDGPYQYTIGTMARVTRFGVPARTADRPSSALASVHRVSGPATARPLPAWAIAGPWCDRARSLARRWRRFPGPGMSARSWPVLSSGRLQRRSEPLQGHSHRFLVALGAVLRPCDHRRYPRHESAPVIFP